MQFILTKKLKIFRTSDLSRFNPHEKESATRCGFGAGQIECGRQGQRCVFGQMVCCGEMKMAKRLKKGHKSPVQLQGYIVVTFADDKEQARDYESLLKVNDIPVTVTEQEDQMGNSEIAVMVPEEFLDEAHVIIESQDSFDDFYDFEIDEEEDGAFGGDVYEDDF